MNHESIRQWSLPENRAVVGIDAGQRIENLVLIGAMGNVSEGLEYPATADHTQLWHG